MINKNLAIKSLKTFFVLLFKSLCSKLLLGSLVIFQILLANSGNGQNVKITLSIMHILHISILQKLKNKSYYKLFMGRYLCLKTLQLFLPNFFIFYSHLQGKMQQVLYTWQHIHALHYLCTVESWQLRISYWKIEIDMLNSYLW